MQFADFKVDEEKCTGCGLCLNVCPGNMVGGDVLRIEEGHPFMVDQSKFGWEGCWKCQHCLAMCPTGAISLLGVTSDVVSCKPDPSIAQELSKLMRYRRTCRDFKKDNVDPSIIEELIDAVSAVPTGGNNQRLEFTVVAARNAMKRLYKTIFEDLDQPKLFDDDLDDLSAMRIYDAPHLFIAHKQQSDRFQSGDFTEIGLATAYFELLANAYGLGTVMSTWAAELLLQNPAARELLGIPEDHRFLTVVGFGYPRYVYARGVSKSKPTLVLK